MTALFGERGSSRRWWTWVVALFLGAVAVRVGYILLFRLEPFAGTFPTSEGGTVSPLGGDEPFLTRLWGDGYVYSHQARLLVDGEGLIAPFAHYFLGIDQAAADHPPLYVLYLAVSTFLFDVRTDLGHMLWSAPFAALCAPTFALLARRVWSPRAGLIAGFIGAFNPSIVHFPAFALSETMTLPLVALTCLSLYRLWDHRRWGDAALTGFLVGVTSLCRPDITMLVPFAVIPMILLLRATVFRHKFALLCVAGLATLAPVLPWFAYNLGRFEKPVMMSTGFDYSLTQGSCDRSYYGELIGYYWLPCMADRLEGTDLQFADQTIGAEHMRKETVAYIKDNLAWTPVVMAARVGRVVGVFRPIQQANLEHITEAREWWLTNTSVLTYYPLALLSVVGMVVMRRARRLSIPLVATVASALLGAAITLAVLRYRASAEPALAVFAAVAVDATIGWIQRAWRDRGPIGPELTREPDLAGVTAL